MQQDRHHLCVLQQHRDSGYRMVIGEHMTDVEKFYVQLVLAVLITSIVIFLFAVNVDNMINVAHFIDKAFIHPTLVGYVDCWNKVTADGHVGCAPTPVSPAWWPFGH